MKYSETSVIERSSSRTIQSSTPKNWVKNNKYSEFEHTSRADENGTRINDCRDKPNTTERLAEFKQAALFKFLNKSAMENNFGTNYVRQPKFHCSNLFSVHHCNWTIFRQRFIFHTFLLTIFDDASNESLWTLRNRTSWHLYHPAITGS